MRRGVEGKAEGRVRPRTALYACPLCWASTANFRNHKWTHLPGDEGELQHGVRLGAVRRAGSWSKDPTDGSFPKRIKPSLLGVGSVHFKLDGKLFQNGLEKPPPLTQPRTEQKFGRRREEAGPPYPLGFASRSKNRVSWEPSKCSNFSYVQ